MRRLAIAVVLLAACSDPPEVTCSTTALGRTHYVRTGVQVSLEAGISVGCFASNGMNAGSLAPKATEVLVEVLDPDNRPAAATATPLRHSGGSGRFTVTTEVTFQVDRPGAWTVIARFEPNLGRDQFLVRTLAFRSDAGFREVAVPELPADCTGYGVTASGTPACLFSDPAQRGVAPVLAIGAQRLSGARFAIDGDAVWLQTGPPAQVQRQVANDAGVWEASHRYVLPSDLERSLLAAGHGHAYLFVASSATGQDIARLTPESDGGVAVTRVPFGAGRAMLALAPGPTGVLVLSHASTGVQSVAAVRTDGGIQATSAGGIDNLPIGHDDGTLWLGRVVFDATLRGVGTVTALRTTGDALVSQSVGALGPTMGFPAAGLAPQTPLVRVLAEGDESWIALPVLGSDELGIESFVVGPGYEEISSATRRHAFARSKDRQTLKIIDR